MKIGAFFGAMLLLTACIGTETGNPVKDDLHVTLSYAPLASSFAASDGKLFELVRADIDVEDLSIDSCSGAAVSVIETARTLKLLENPSDAFDLEQTSYCSVALHIRRVIVTLTTQSQGQTGGMSQASASSMSAVDVDVKMRITMPKSFALEHPHLILAFDVGSWVDPLGFEINEKGAIVLGHPVDRTQLEDAIRKGILLFDDRDEDGKLDAAELDAASLLGDEAAAVD